MTPPVLTERQQKWFASVRASLEKSTGRSLDEWREVMKACPVSAPRAQLAWLKAEHGVGVNYGSTILDACRSGDGPGWDEPEALRAALWKDPASLAILIALERAAAPVAGVVPTQRKGYTAFSRAVQFAAMRPLKGGKALLGLKLDPSVSPRLAPSRRRESWSERLTAVVELGSPADVDDEVARLFVQAAGNG
ncbi:MAG TPA: DUF4287 domain-containing protein [Brevundimonas sp.]|jgi:hypothetical protein|uniref:DUF4287 domain-containing protein n=1 Tax=Brevundimonas sp. TaxID=1871086 RepID=UPI002DE875D1|nr:DUF4287 domain-containing protein [Brevundimonas sp.]